MTTSELRPAPAPEDQGSASRSEVLAALVAAEADRVGDPIGYQYTIVEILRCLDDVDRGALDAPACIERIYAHIADAVAIDPFERRALSR